MKLQILEEINVVLTKKIQKFLKMKKLLKQINKYQKVNPDIRKYL